MASRNVKHERLEAYREARRKRLEPHAADIEAHSKATKYNRSTGLEKLPRID